VDSGRWSVLAYDLFFEAAEAGDKKEGERKKIGTGAVGEGGSDFGEDFARGDGLFDGIRKKAFRGGEEQADAKRSTERLGAIAECDVCSVSD
jgi:hypothetical protein